MPRTAATPEQRAHIREKIRRAAAAVCEENGTAGASARLIAQQADVSVGTLYSYFENLPELLRSLWAEPVEEELARLRSTVEATADPLMQIQILLEGYSNFALDHPDILKGAFLVVRRAHPPLPEAPPAAVEFERLLCKAVLDGQKTGQVKQGNTEHIAHQLWAGVQGALGLPVHIDSLNFGSPKKLANSMIGTMIDAIKA